MRRDRTDLLCIILILVYVLPKQSYFIHNNYTYFNVYIDIYIYINTFFIEYKVQFVRKVNSNCVIFIFVLHPLKNIQDVAISE